MWILFRVIFLLPSTSRVSIKSAFIYVMWIRYFLYFVLYSMLLIEKLQSFVFECDNVETIDTFGAAFYSTLKWLHSIKVHAERLTVGCGLRGQVINFNLHLLQGPNRSTSIFTMQVLHENIMRNNQPVKSCRYLNLFLLMSLK